MKCEDCPYLMTPFFVCKKYRWRIYEKGSMVWGCNVDGELPPIEDVVPPRVGGNKK